MVVSFPLAREVFFCLFQSMKEKKSKTVAACLCALAFVFMVEISYQLFGSFKTIWNVRQGLMDQISPWLAKPINCDRSHTMYDLCYVSSPTILDPVAATLSAIDPTKTTLESFEKIRPYPRKWQNQVMSRIKEFTLNTAPSNATCAVTHNVPALVFSAGGYSGNYFHDFTDGFVPLYITVNSLFPNQEFILAIVNCHDRWPIKYAQLLGQFTRHPIINLDKETIKHCFTSATVGLISHGPMIMDPNLFRGPNRKTFQDFRAFLASTFSQGDPFSKQAFKEVDLIEGHPTLPTQVEKTRPRLVLVSRKGNRRILNEEEIRKAAEEIGFTVMVFEPTKKTTLAEVFRLIDSSHAVTGVHGAGLTNILFLRPGSVFTQVVPIGIDWLADSCFGKLAVQLGLEYTEYKLEAHESSLQAKYGKNSLELSDPGAIISGSWSNMDIYLKQDVRLDVARFKKHLGNAYEKAKSMMRRENLYVEKN